MIAHTWMGQLSIHEGLKLKAIYLVLASKKFSVLYRFRWRFRLLVIKVIQADELYSIYCNKGNFPPNEEGNGMEIGLRK